jgi:hypothetical protein
MATSQPFSVVKTTPGFVRKASLAAATDGYSIVGPPASGIGRGAWAVCHMPPDNDVADAIKTARIIVPRCSFSVDASMSALGGKQTLFRLVVPVEDEARIAATHLQQPDARRFLDVHLGRRTPPR